MKDLEVTELSPHDWRLFKDIRLEALQSDPDAFGATLKGEASWNDEEWIKRISDPKRFYLFAKSYDKITGMVGVAQSKEEEKILIVIGMYINKEFRKQGLGKRLLEEALDRARKFEGYDNIKLWVHKDQHPAINLYKSMGFVTVEEIGEEENIDPMYHNSLVMIKAL